MTARRAGTLVLLAIGCWAVAARAQGDPAAADAGRMAVVDVLRRGQELETQQRWGEALLHYEDALRQFPGDRGLKQRFDVSRLHYDLARRYNDHSFREMVGRLSLAESLDVYNEVLLKIQTHYVDAPQWRELVDRGTDELQIALGDKAFLAANGGRGENVPGCVRQVRAHLQSRPIDSRRDAREAVAAAAQLAADGCGVSAAAVAMEFVCGAANCLDHYSTYLTPGQLGEVYAQIEGNFVGLGVELKAVDGALKIVRVISGSPARQAGLRPGDRITAVDGRPTAALTTDRAADLLQGEAGTVVELQVQDAQGSARTIRVRRQRVEVPSVDEVQMLDAGRKIAYLKLACFQKTTRRDLEAALWRLHQEGMRTLIVDVRGNPGGLLAASVEVADLFIDRGVIVFTRGRSTQEDCTYSARIPGTWQVPLVVLIDQESASAAEILAGAIRDHRRGTVIGTRSYGKGSVQGIFSLAQAGAGLRLTTAKFYSPNGHPYSGIGIEPDLVVRQASRPVAGGDPLAAQNDAVLAAGLQEARRMLTAATPATSTALKPTTP